jgi:hypothetical protein
MTQQIVNWRGQYQWEDFFKMNQLEDLKGVRLPGQGLRLASSPWRARSRQKSHHGGGAVLRIDRSRYRGGQAG